MGAATRSEKPLSMGAATRSKKRHQTQGMRAKHAPPKRPQIFVSSTLQDSMRIHEVAHRVLHEMAQQQETLARVQRSFSWFATLAPRRVWQEETGDALETIAAMQVAGCSAFKIRLKVWSTILWVLLNGLRETIAALTGRKSPHR